MSRVEVVPPDLTWPEAFAQESARVAVALGRNVAAIHHIGSTAIPGIYAKPIIDLLVEVHDLTLVDQQNAAMAALGYRAMGKFGLAGRRYFRKDNSAGVRTHHIHAFQVGSDQVTRHLTFRDYLIAHPGEAYQYSELKRRLAQRYPTDIQSYMDGKDGFIRAIDRRAAQWRVQQRDAPTALG